MKTKYIVTMSNGETATRITHREYAAAVEAINLQGERGVMNWCGSVGLAMKAAEQLKRWGFREVQIHPVCLA